MTPNILLRIAAKRRARIEREGYGLSFDVPEVRRGPGAGVLPFLPSGGVICEIKRRSPSRGNIDEGLDHLAQAQLYVDHGADAVSVLTEEDHFGGSLGDLMEVRERFPGLPILRKDFLLDTNDIEVSYRAGADAVLLIASMLDPELLAEMHRVARGLGMASLVEVHNKAEVDGVRRACGADLPPLVGINARDLTTFRVDPLVPLEVRPSIDWPARVVYESGVFEAEQAAVASSAGFDSVLVGEAVVRDPARIERIRSGLSGSAPAGAARSASGFWPKLTARMKPAQPLVKICGVTNYEDGAEAARLGADLLGFVFADSPRRADPDVVKACAELNCLKVAVVVNGVPPEVAQLVEEGYLDAVQFHGEEAPEECASLAFPYYKAVRVRSVDDSDLVEHYRCPRVLVDAYSDDARGGTGCRIEPEAVLAVSDRAALWLAGGLDPETIAAAIARYEPELIDVSSGLEAEPGRKDHRKLKGFFREINNA